MRKLIAAIALALALSAFAAEGPTVNIYTANAEALAAALHGVGSKKAAAIIAYREANGPFESVEELVRVSGIGPVTLERNRERIVIEVAEVPDE